MSKRVFEVHVNQTHFHMKAFAPGLVFKKRGTTYLSINLIFENKQKQRKRDPKRGNVFKGPNTVFARAFADAI